MIDVPAQTHIIQLGVLELARAVGQESGGVSHFAQFEQGAYGIGVHIDILGKGGEYESVIILLVGRRLAEDAC